ncbi:MAG: hypothetical protein R3B13_01585 [Polyangiaceae bacterium]
MAWSAPAPKDVGSLCLDVLDTRACWQGNAAGNVRRVPRPLPNHFTSQGYRCAGGGESRTCRERRQGADAFACHGDVCTQRYPCMPDDGEWECADHDGAAVCRKLAGAAGIVEGPADPSWVCGVRNGKAAEKICVDLSPDRPRDGDYICRFQYEPSRPRRSCRRGQDAVLGRDCAAGCPAGSTCVGERCLPLMPAPNCYLDADCTDKDKCLHGTCRSAAP